MRIKDICYCSTCSWRFDLSSTLMASLFRETFAWNFFHVHSHCVYTLLRIKTQVVRNYFVSYIKRKMPFSRKFTEEQEKLVICKFAELGSAAKAGSTFRSWVNIVGRAASSFRDQEVITWPAHSSHLTPLDFCFWGHRSDKIQKKRQKSHRFSGLGNDFLDDARRRQNLSYSWVTRGPCSEMLWQSRMPLSALSKALSDNFSVISFSVDLKVSLLSDSRMKLYWKTDKGSDKLKNSKFEVSKIILCHSFLSIFDSYHHQPFPLFDDVIQPNKTLEILESAFFKHVSYLNTLEHSGPAVTLPSSCFRNWCVFTDFLASKGCCGCTKHQLSKLLQLLILSITWIKISRNSPIAWIKISTISRITWIEIWLFRRHYGSKYQDFADEKVDRKWM